MNRYLLVLLLLCLASGCSKIKSKYDEAKESVTQGISDALRLGFYSDPGAWDFYRIPLIAPYELTSIDYPNLWHCDSLFSARLSVEYVGITDSVIYMSYTEELKEPVPVEKEAGFTYDGWEKRRYVIIDVPTDSIEWHETETEWTAALNKRNITKINLHQADSVYDAFAHDRQLLFTPPNRQ